LSTLQNASEPAAGVCVSFVSETFARGLGKSGEVKRLTIEGVDVWRTLGPVCRRDRSLPRAAQSFITLIRENKKTANANDRESQVVEAHR
jgi:DNA-binding transcriptional LysR family regulator